MTKKESQYWGAWAIGWFWGALTGVLTGATLTYCLIIPNPPNFTFTAPESPSVWSAQTNIATTSFNSFKSKAKGQCSVVYTEIRSCEK